MGRGGGGQVVSVHAFHSDDLSSNTAFSVKFVFERTKINKKRSGLPNIKKQNNLENTHQRVKCYCTADLLFDSFGFNQTSKPIFIILEQSIWIQTK